MYVHHRHSIRTAQQRHLFELLGSSVPQVAPQSFSSLIPNPDARCPTSVTRPLNPDTVSTMSLTLARHQNADTRSRHDTSSESGRLVSPHSLLLTGSLCWSSLTVPPYCLPPSMSHLLAYFLILPIAPPPPLPYWFPLVDSPNLIPPPGPFLLVAFLISPKGPPH